jgi:hypothetical protein
MRDAAGKQAQARWNHDDWLKALDRRQELSKCRQDSCFNRLRHGALSKRLNTAATPEAMKPFVLHMQLLRGQAS